MAPVRFDKYFSPARKSAVTASTPQKFPNTSDYTSIINTCPSEN